MVKYHVYVEASSHLVILRNEDCSSSEQSMQEAVESALKDVPRVLASVLEGEKCLIDTISVSIGFNRKLMASTLYKLMDKAEAHSLGLFEILDQGDDDSLEILPEPE